MELNKCIRCGCFYTSEVNVCPKCEQKDITEIDTLKSFLSDITETEITSIEDISYKTGITTKNLDRFFELDEFKKFKF